MTGMEALTAGGWFVTVGLNLAVEILKENYRVLSVKDSMVASLSSNSSLMQSIADTIERQLMSQCAPDENIKAWLSMLKETLYKAEDVLDIMEYKKLVHKQEKGLIHMPNSLRKLKNIIKLDKEIKELKDVVTKLDALGQQSIHFKDILKWNQECKTGDKDETVAKVDIPVEKLERELDSTLNKLGATKKIKMAGEYNSTANGTGKAELNVVCITGFAGVGKTTLAKLVYDDEQINKSFGEPLWVHVREIHEAKKVMNKILRQLGSCSLNEEDSLVIFEKEIRRLLKGRKFLLILYGIRSVVRKQWREVKAALRNGVEGSAILVTARKREIADILAPRDSQITVDFLDYDKCRRLFHKCAVFGKKLEKHDIEKLRGIGDLVCQHLYGLPSAVKTLGRILNSNPKAKCWNVVTSGKWWEHEQLAQEVLPSLLSNYLELPSQIQQCFRYCSIFPKKYVFDRDRLVQMWIAQGYIQPSKNSRLEDIGRKWFDDLTDRFFFKKNGRGKFFMHDRVRDLAIYVSSDECFVAEHVANRPPSTVRHLAITTNDIAILNNLCSEKLRTLLIFGKFDPQKFGECMNKVLNKSKSLRVLVTQSGLPSLPSELPHLRYLGVLSHKSSQLPGAVCKLLHLQFLDLVGDDCYLPEGMKSLINLRYLYANPRTVSRISAIGNLTSLQELEIFQVGSKEGHKIKELNGLNELKGRLCISNLGLVGSKTEAHQANLMNKIHLETLQLRDNVTEAILEGLQPHPNISNLEISSYMDNKFPNWMIESLSYYTNLQYVHLKDHLNLTKLAPFGEIKNLEILVLENLGLKTIDYELYGRLDDTFPSLKVLIVANLSGLTTWRDFYELKTRNFFPVLQTLKISNCKYLNNVPNLSMITSLEELTILGCSSLSSLIHRYIDDLKYLRVVEIFDNPHIASLYLSGHPLLQKLVLQRCDNLKLPNGFKFLNNLATLHVSVCPGVNLSVLSKLLSLENLSTDHSLFRTYGRRKLLQTMPSLRILKLEGYNLNGITSEQDIWFQELTSLQELEFIGCIKLDRLPATLDTCSSLKKLVIHSCQKILSLPTQLPTSLQELQIKQCPTLGLRCQRKMGIDWPKISYIPNISVDGITIQKKL